MGWWTDEVISIPRPTYRRFVMLAEELAYLQDGEELRGYEIKERTTEIMRRVLDEYVRQHFEESTKTAVQLANRHRPK